ncbi:hypothetical protein M9H77_02141 [Catharanthus roseus]|uniref:Uncharacterized protein n=1 Tax=Catharanthus roseus TaxID=4058 RepID=A0ACC0C7J1_CATRO|nr:hypothetical protein M9H77_02141 [Catharanthus roseus]
MLSIACLSLASFARVAIAKSTASLKAFLTSLIFSKSSVTWGCPSSKKILECLRCTSFLHLRILPLFLRLLVLGVLEHRRFFPLTHLPHRYHHSISARLLIWKFMICKIVDILRSFYTLILEKKKSSINILLYDVTK